MLTQWFDPEPTFKGLTFAKELARLGHEVEVLTGFPNYPGGKLYAGYTIKFFQRELMEGISVIRVPIYPSHDKSAIRRIANYTSFSISAATIGHLLVKTADVIYVYHPPATVGFPAIALHMLQQIPFVYDIQDLWPDTLSATGMLSNETAFRIVDKWCRFIYKHASRIVVLSPGFKEKLCDRGVPQDKVEVIYNWCDENQIHTSIRNEALAKELGMAGRFNIVFAGTMGKAQALDAVLDAASRLGSQYSMIQFVFMGGGIEVSRLKQGAKGNHFNNVLFLPRRPMSEISEILNLADVLLVHLKDDPLFRITIPSKTQAYIAAGRPILMAVRGDAAALVTKADAGISCTPEDSESIAQGVGRLFTMSPTQREALGENGKRFYQKELSLAVGVHRFEEVFRAISGSV